MKEIIKELKQNKAEIDRSENRLADLAEEIKREESELHARYEKVYAEGRKLSQESDLLQSLNYLFSDQLSLKNGALYYRDRSVRDDEFHSPQELEKEIRAFLASAFEILQNEGDPGSKCEELARRHQRIMKFVQNKQQYEIQYSEGYFSPKRAEQKSLRDKISGLKDKNNKLFLQLRSGETRNAVSVEINDQRKCNPVYAENIRIPIGECYFHMDGADSVLLQSEWNLREHGILCIDVAKEAAGGNDLSDFLKATLLYCLFSYPPIAKRLLLCDRTSNEQIISFAGQLSESVGGLFFNDHQSFVVEQSEADIASALHSVSETISRRIVLLGRSGDADILSYNAKNTDNIQPLIFVLLYGYPGGYSQSYEVLGGALKNGKKAGVYFILVSDSGFQAEDDWTSRKLPEIDPDDRKSCKFTLGVKGKGSILEDEILYETKRISPDLNLTALLHELGKQISETKENIPFLSVIPEEEFSTSRRRTDFSKILSIPVGKVGSKSFTLDLDSTGDAHVVICGTTGSGKSSLLNTMILSAGMLYSPQEVEINLISITKSEFNIFSENGLPHLKTIITSDNVVGANDVLDYLTGVMQKRMNMIGSKSDIVMYNRSVADGKKIPRCLIIIDEYQRLITDDKARDKLREIAELGRSCGISLVLSSQSVPVEFHNALMLFRHRFEFRGSSIGDLIPGVAHRQNELEVLNGLFFYGKGNEATLARLAYAGKDAELIGNINEVKKCHKKAQMQLTSEIPQRIIEDKEEIPFISPSTQRDYDENGVCKIRLGQKYLTNSQVEYAFSYKNCLLCLCGEYLLTKEIEAAIIKDVLYLSRKESCRTVFYLDLNKNPNWARRPTAIKKQKDLWTLYAGGRFSYYAAAQAEAALDDIEGLLSEREEDETVSICPVIVMVTCADQIAPDSDEEYRLCALLDKGKNGNVFFVLQFNEFQRNLNEICRRIDIIEDAIILPDREVEGEQYSSSALLSFLEQTEAASTTAKEMCSTFVKSPLNPKLNLLCNNSEVVCFAPYHYTDEFFKKILEE